ncbi:lysis system o-spanin lipoprotein Rz1 [Escherichia coli]|uniref:lysis system o-spanin lipoprotein Rz1 n=1 Tax=Escherichia coli TaxID=562 RepID=UPI001D0869D8|nr:lysis system o-spanin lipoprotein Rz1 [Escherichia coli]MCB6898164.1 lysis system o-spanin lipoprotein Rz1 [Escherichia coli]MCB6923534.1 lysis system o-spanin lipoprotein Rz1 [Escherichia coli]
MVAGCSSKENALCHPQPKPPAPPAWAMMPPSNSLQLLDETFSVSDLEIQRLLHRHNRRFPVLMSSNATIWAI